MIIDLTDDVGSVPQKVVIDLSSSRATSTTQEVDESMLMDEAVSNKHDFNRFHDYETYYNLPALCDVPSDSMQESLPTMADYDTFGSAAFQYQNDKSMYATQEAVYLPPQPLQTIEQPHNKLPQVFRYKSVKEEAEIIDLTEN